MRGLCYQHHVASRGCLYSGRDIGSLTEDFEFVAATRTNHYYSRIDADPCCQLYIRESLVQPEYRFKNRQSRADSTLRVVAVSFWPSKISHYSVAQVLSDAPTEAVDRPGGRPMVSSNQLAPLFRIQLCRNAGRADQIAEQHCQMTPRTAR